MVLSLCSFCLSSSGQDQVKKFTQEQAVQIKTIDPKSTNYSDLETIGKAIGDSKIVMLGEQDHGDAPTFLAKTRLIKYLHEQKGFNVLAFEVDFFSTNYNWKVVKSGELSIDGFIKKNISAIWSAWSACDPLFRQYIPATLKTATPLEISGFDSQMGTQFIYSLLDSVLQRLNLPMTKLAEYHSKIYPLLTTWYEYTNDTATNKKIVNYLSQIREQMLTKLDKDDFWILTINNLIAQNLQFNNWKKDFGKDMNTRDRQMAANLKWLAETKYANDKIIVWAHNYHISKYAGHYHEEWANKTTPMGSIFTQDSTLMRKTYILGFTSYKGTAGRLFKPIYKLDKPKPNSFENWINKNYEYAFVDFKNSLSNINEPFYMSGATLGNNKYHTNYLAQWNKIFDGVFYIKQCIPAIE